MKDNRGILDLTRQIDELKQKVHDAELETSLIKAIGQNSPEMKALQQRVKELEAQLKLKELRESGL
jgi:predicted nuclease with TOPRIM domain